MDLHPNPFAFVCAFRKHLFAVMSGGASVPFVALAAYSESKWEQVSFVVLAVMSCWITAYQLWKIEREKVCSLQERLSPKIGVSLDAHYGGIAMFPIAGKPSRKWVQFVVSCATESALIDCEAWLKSVDRIDDQCEGLERLVEEPVRCAWSQTDDKKITIHPTLEKCANLFSFDRDDAAPIPQVCPKKPTLIREIKKPGDYRITVVVTARDCPPKNADFIFTWRDFDDMTITQET
jgi:hypothetical protein